MRSCLPQLLRTEAILDFKCEVGRAKRCEARMADEQASASFSLGSRVEISVQMKGSSDSNVCQHTWEAATFFADFFLFDLFF